MRARCSRPTHPSWADYGGRGISVSLRWQRSYAAFLKDMGRRPTKYHSLERIDNDKGYYPENCRWATKADQQANRRNNRLSVEVVRELRAWHRAGVPAAWLAEAMGMNSGNMWRALRGQSWRQA